MKVLKKTVRQIMTQRNEKRRLFPRMVSHMRSFYFCDNHESANLRKGKNKTKQLKYSSDNDAKRNDIGK